MSELETLINELKRNNGMLQFHIAVDADKALREIQSLQAENRALREANEWRPINIQEMPADTDIILYPGWPEEPIVVGFIPSGEDYFVDNDGRRVPRPTHWRPILPPPEASDE